ncbi:MAG TPA: hypothetical protein VIE88_09005, partial [Vicinamibacteria bacterium]
DPVLFLLSQVATNEGGRTFWASRSAKPYRDYFPRMEFLAARAQFVGKSYLLFADLDERISPLSPEPLFLSDYLRRYPLSAEDRVKLGQALLRETGSFGRLGRTLAVHAALENGAGPLDVLGLPEGLMARILLARALEPQLNGEVPIEVCRGYLSALGVAMMESSSVLARPSTDALVSRADECITRFPEVAVRLRLDLVKLLAGAGAQEEALDRLEALDREGLVDKTDPAERNELVMLGRRLALSLGRTKVAEQWEARGSGGPSQGAVVQESAVPPAPP